MNELIADKMFENIVRKSNSNIKIKAQVSKSKPSMAKKKTYKKKISSMQQHLSII